MIKVLARVRITLAASSIFKFLNKKYFPWANPVHRRQVYVMDKDHKISSPSNEDPDGLQTLDSIACLGKTEDIYFISICLVASFASSFLPTLISRSPS